MYIIIKTEVSMKIQTINSTTFGIKFLDNYALKEVKTYAAKINKADELNRIIDTLEKSGSEVVTINHGIDKTNKVFSNFFLNGIKVNNTPYDSENAVQTTFRALFDLATFGGRYRALTNSKRLFRPYGE